MAFGETAIDGRRQPPLKRKIFVKMHALFSRLPLALLGALIGVIFQLTWLSGHGWEEAAARIPAGAVGGGIVFWLLGELAARLLRRKGRDFWSGVARFWPWLGRPTLWRGIAAVWVALVVGFCGGLYVYGHRAWPFPVVQQLEAWYRGEGATTFGEKLENDLDIVPARHLVTADIKAPGDRVYKDVEGLPLRSRRLSPKYYLSPDAPRAYRIIFGIFDFTDRRFGVVLLDPQGKVVHIWKPTQEDVPWEHRDDANLFPHGFAVDRDGSIYIAYDNGTSLTKYDYCGRIVWRLQGGFHHSITLADNNTLWVWGPTKDDPHRKDCLVQLDRTTGKFLRAIPLQEVLDANPEIDVFGIRQLDERDRSTWVADGGGQWHPNDIDPLPVALAPQFPQFKAGDLLVSLRSVDLVFVMDPNTLKVKWWRQGLVRRQHDPDWSRRGTITILNNNMHRDFSSIVEVDPKTYQSKVLLDGKKYNFYTYIQGKHQTLPNGGILITSPQQGRVFEVDGNGKVVFEFLNVYDHQNRFLYVSEAESLPVDYFKELPKCP